MLSLLASDIRAMSAADYLVLYLVMTAMLILLLIYGFRAFRRFRFVSGTATSKIRSAAQGHVELKGLGEFVPNGVITSPFSGDRCLWYHCTIEKRKRSGKRVTWTNISSEISEQLFRLVDETGDCLVDPDHAQVIPEVDRSWLGHGPEYRRQRPQKRSYFSISTGLGDYRFRERLIRPATAIYALGWFHTVHRRVSDEAIDRQVDDLVKQWKLQPQRYLADFDFDANGKIQQSEWKAVRAAARRQVLEKMSRQKREHHLLKNPPGKGLPYIISALQEEDLVARKKFRAITSVGIAFVLLGALVFMSSVRLPFPT